MTTQELMQLNNILYRQMQQNQKLIEALRQDTRTHAGVAEDLTRVFDALLQFQHQNPEVFKTLCEEARDGGEVTLSDALNAIAHAAGLVQE